MKKLSVILRDGRFWILLLSFLLITFLHYAQLFLFSHPGESSLLGLQRHTVERIFFLAPIILGGVIFGLKGGLICLGLALAAMLPRVFLLSSYPRTALLETLIVCVAGVWASWWLESHRREVGQREQALLRLEAVRKELQSYIQSIRENEKRLSVLHSVTAAIGRLIAIDDILSAAADKIKEAINVDVVLVFLLDEGSGRLRLRTHRGVSNEFAQQVDGLRVGEGFNGWVVQTGEPCLIEDSTIDPRVAREIVRKEGMRSQYIVPLKSRERVVGTLCTASYSLKEFTTEEQELLKLIGAELGVAVEKAMLYEESQRMGRRFRELFERAHDAIWLHDFQGNILAVNRAALDLTGYEPDELLGQRVSKFLTPQQLELAREVRRKLLSGEEIKQPYEQTLIRKDGTKVVVMVTTSLLTEEGMPPAFQNIMRDVTRERQLQENLRLYVRQITKAQEEERKRIARELHDDTIQALVVLSRRLDDLLSNKPRSSQKMLSQLEGIRSELDETLKRMRRFIQDLRPPTLEYLGLLPALRELVLQLNQQAGIESVFHVRGPERHFAPEDEVLIYRIVQEALRNVWKHSGARKAQVVIDFGQDKTRVMVEDDGRGFEFREDSGFVRVGKIGLAGMQERAGLLGGQLIVESSPGKGTKVVLEIPSGRLRD
ncbi:MAG: hypothetical protein DRI26_02555 [Chloroflexi bacterium]|nr:MAG: hypothetical protein DRI26_02555 [Chloroflexota bacterium]